MINFLKNMKNKIKKKEAQILCSRLNHIIAQIPQVNEERFISGSIVDQFHLIVKEAGEKLDSDYLKFMVPITEKIAGSEEWWHTVSVRTKIYEMVGALKAEFNLDKEEFGEIAREKILELLKNISWQIILLLLGITAIVIAAIILSKLGIKD